MSEDGKTLDLLFGKCAACGGLSFPANAYGCATCGEPDLETIAVPGCGKLLAFTTLYAPPLPSIELPQGVGEIEIADGIVEEAMVDAHGVEMTPGLELIAMPKPTKDDPEKFDLVFVPEGAA